MAATEWFGPIMFVVLFLAFLGWGIYNKRHLPPWWPNEAPPEFIAFGARLEAMAREIGEALSPTFTALAEATNKVVKAFEEFAASFAAAFEKQEG